MTGDRRTGDSISLYSERERAFTFAKKQLESMTGQEFIGAVIERT